MVIEVSKEEIECMIHVLDRDMNHQGWRDLYVPEISGLTKEECIIKYVSVGIELLKLHGEWLGTDTLCP